MEQSESPKLFYGTHTVGASRGHLSDSLAFLFPGASISQCILIDTSLHGMMPDLSWQHEIYLYSCKIHYTFLTFVELFYLTVSVDNIIQISTSVTQTMEDVVLQPPAPTL